MGQKCQLKPGDVVNRTYEAVRLLGAGYSGEVWEVLHLFVGARLALKLMHEEDRDNAHKASRFGAEASTLFDLAHENVVRVLDANQTPEGLLYIVMELLQGETLTQRQAAGRIHPLRALKHAHDLASGLSAAHEIGVVHRDVKPDNVFITTDDVAKLLDFTAAKFSLANLRTTEPRDRVGTLAFMSPEHLSGKPADPRMDQYSLGMVVYGMLRGRHAFEHLFGNQNALMNAQYNVVPEPLAKVAGLPAWVDALLAPALAKDLDERYPTMAELGRQIWEAGRRLAKEIKEGRVVVDVPLGEPPIDFDGGSGEPGARKTYVPPKRPARHTTGPVMPSQRVTLAPGAATARAEPSGDTPDLDSAVTAPLPASSEKAATAPRSTTAPVHATAAETQRVQRPARSRVRLAWLSLALAVPAAGGLLWRTRASLATVEVSVLAAPASATVEPSPPATPASVTTAPAPPMVPAPTTSVTAHAPPREIAPPPAALTTRTPARTVAAAPAAKAMASSTATAAPATAAPVTPPPPAPTVAPHRVFVSEE
jgi:serine/threonine-protein kinase